MSVEEINEAAEQNKRLRWEGKVNWDGVMSADAALPPRHDLLTRWEVWNPSFDLVSKILEMIMRETGGVLVINKAMLAGLHDQILVNAERRDDVIHLQLKSVHDGRWNPIRVPWSSIVDEDRVKQLALALARNRKLVLDYLSEEVEEAKSRGRAEIVEILNRVKENVELDLESERIAKQAEEEEREYKPPAKKAKEVKKATGPPKRFNRG